MVSVKDIMQKDFASIEKTDPVSKLIPKLQKTKAEGAVVFDGKQFAGLITKRRTYKARSDLSKKNISNLIEKLPTLTPELDLLEAAELMYGSNSRILVVLEKEKVVGVVQARDIIARIRDYPEIKALTAREIGTMKIESVNTSSTLGQAVSLMRQKKLGKLPVVDESGKISGIVSFRDVMEKYLTQPVSRNGGFRSNININVKAFEPEKADMLTTPITNQMSGEVVTVTKRDPAYKIAELMRKHGIADVVIAEHDRPIGIVTTRDMLETFLRLLTETRNIQFIGLPELDEVDGKSFESRLTKTYDKVEKILNNVVYLTVHVKQHQVEGARRKYSVHCRLASSGLMIVANSIKKWTLLTALQDALKTLEREVVKAVK